MNCVTNIEKSRIRQDVCRTFKGFGKKRGNLIPILQKVQYRNGYLPKEAFNEIANYIKIPAIGVYSVDTFYSQFRFVPTSKRLIQVCCGTAYHFRNGAAILNEIEKNYVLSRMRLPKTGSIPYRQSPVSEHAHLYPLLKLIKRRMFR